MLTKLTIKNFKRFDEAEVDLGKSVVLIGPNNSGKTTALQALALWELGLRRWTEKRQGKSTALQRQGVAINRRDLVALPVPVANLLWRDLHVRNAERQEGKPKTQNVRVDIMVEGITDDQAWSCGLEFDYANEESFYCRPLRLDENKQPARMGIPEHATKAKVALLPPMSGLTDREFIKQPGEIGVLIGQGQTAQVLRNLCYRVCWPDDKVAKPSADWIALTGQLSRLFGVKLLNPKFVAERSEIVMEYEEKSGTRLDLSSSGRGLQQTLLILAHLYANPRTVLLLDEPDAHLEVLRQRQTYQLINDIAEEKGSQIVAASHSEVVLAEAANRGMVVAFVGKPHLLNDRGSQVMKALTDMGWDQYYQAEETGWVLYVEDSTDLAILKAFARILAHPAQALLEMPFVHYVSTNLPQKSRDHFNGLREAKSEKQKLELTWIGKENRPKLEPRILLEDPAKSYHAKHRVTSADFFDNRLIFGDNLLALKALEGEFSGKVKCVFIDPPYNTGSAFTHYDDGVEHSIWLSLMRDRLEIIKRLLSDDGSLWITIDDNEAHYLKVLCDEVFGANFVCNAIWEKADSKLGSTILN
jgi:ABC-type lipoprotein export system ATPase subunit